MDLKLKGKTAIVTAGSTGIGAGIADVLAEEGMNVIINYRSRVEQAEGYAKTLSEKYGTTCISLKADITKPAEIDETFKEAEKVYGKVHVLVNCAGLWEKALIEDMTDEQWEKLIDVNLNGIYLFSKRAVDHFIKHDIKGHIVNVSSKSGFSINSPGYSAYATAKGALALMTKAFAKEFSDRGIIVNGIAPGIVKTPMNEHILSKPGVTEKYESRIPAGKTAHAREIGYAAAFLASEKASNIIGTIVDVTGGMLI